MIRDVKIGVETSLKFEVILRCFGENGTQVAKTFCLKMLFDLGLLEKQQRIHIYLDLNVSKCKYMWIHRY